MSLYLYNSVVRLDGTTGILTLVAGNGTYGYSGDDGPATSAQLLAPQGLAVDSTGNLYIADTGNLRIRKVSNGVVNGPSTPAPIGSVISLFATGEGQTSPQGVDGKPATAPFPKPNFAIVVILGEDLQELSGDQVQYVGGAPGEVAGLLQINLRIPAGIMPGKAVPVFISNGGTTSQAGVTIAVSGN
jgi:uncharacterized protein (TIGR03437 family)